MPKTPDPTPEELLAGASRTASVANMIEDSNRRDRATIEELVSGVYGPPQKPPPNEDAKPIAWIVRKRWVVSMHDGCYFYQAGTRIEDPSVATELARSGAELVPIYD